MRKQIEDFVGKSDASWGRTVSAVKDIQRDEEGSITILALFLFLAVVAAAGIGIDLMRFERDRASLQSTLDRAVLAAADLDQQVEPKDVVTSYLDKAGLLEHLRTVDVQTDIGYREVSATALSEFPTQFMHLSGVDTLAAPAASTAEEAVGAVEVSIVLDISTSMKEPNLTYLKSAAKKIVTQIGSKNGEWNKEVSFSLIPYASQVNAGADLIKYYNLDRFHPHSHCVNFIDNEFSKPDLLTTTLLEQTAHFDPYTETREPIQHPVCPTRAGSAILPFQNNETVLHDYIDGLSVLGNPVIDEDSGIDNGANWGLALLDPSARPVINGLANTDGIVPKEFTGRPVDYNSDVLKVLILVSDGDNTDQFMLNPSMRTTMSDIWYNEEANTFSVYQSNGNPEYWWPHDNSWQDHPYGNGGKYCKGKGGQQECIEQKAEVEKGTSKQLSYVELLNLVSLEYIENNIFTHSPSAYGQWESKAFEKKNAVAKDQRTKHVCKAAKDEGVIVFGVGVSAPSAGKDVLQNCASSPSHYYDATAVDLTDAFTSIASSVRMLRLTQ